MASVGKEQVIKEQGVGDELDEPLIKLPNGKRLFFAAILYCCFCFDLAIRYGINAILPLLQNDLQISNTEVGFLSGAVFLGMAVFVMPISFLGEQKSQRRAISLCSILWSGVTVLCGMANSAVTLALLRLGVGAGNAAFAPLSTAMLTSWYQKSAWGKVLGLYNTAMSVGGVLGMLLFAAIANAMGWRWSFYLIGGISLVISLLTFLLPDHKKRMVEATTEREQVNLNVRDTVHLLLHNRALLLMCLGAGIAVMTLNISNTFISIYYCDMLGVSVTTAASLVALSTPVGLIAYPLGGVILDKWYKRDRRARMHMPMLCILAAAVTFFFGYQLVSVPLILLANGLYNLGNTSFHTAAHELVPVWYKSVSYGSYVLFIQMLGAIGPMLGGRMVDTMGIQRALSYCQGFFLISVVTLFFAGAIYQKYYAQARQAERASA